jgi:integrase
MPRFTVKTVLTPSGERLPVLLDRLTGMPAFHPNLFALTVLRQVNRASATIERALREIAVLYVFLDEEGIDLADRIRGGQLLSLGEIDGLARYCRQSIKSSLEDAGAKNIGVVRVYRLSKKSSNSTNSVSTETAANRLRTIHAYLSWLIMLRLSHTEQGNIVREKMENIRNIVLPLLIARVPSTKGRNVLGLRQGLASETLDRLLQVVIPASSENPWKSAFAQQRNALIVCWLWLLGLRRGELLNLKISDIDFRKNEVLIVRRADAPEDPRKYQPRVKTRDRKLSLCNELAKLTHNYIIKERANIAGARKHSYLFVAEHSGTPMALTTLNKLFQTLRLKVHDMPNDLSAHMLRHTWNDEFSRKLKGKQIEEAKEEMMRNYMMGWGPNSSSAGIYTRKYIEENARHASLNLQNKMMRKK